MLLIRAFLAHPHNQGVSYFVHLQFAMGIAIQLGLSVFFFTLHAIFPFIDIPRSLDLEASTHFLQQQNNWIEGQKPEGNFGLQRTK